MKSFRKKHIITIIIIIVLAVIVSYVTLFQKTEHQNAISGKTFDTVSNPWDDSDVPAVSDISIEVDLTDYAEESQIVNNEISQDYGSPVISLASGDFFQFDVDVKEEGLYKISMDYAVSEAYDMDCVLGVMLDGEYPYDEAQNIVLPQLLTVAEYPFNRDNSGNEIVPDVYAAPVWQTGNFRTMSQKTTDSVLFHLKEGTNTLAIQIKQGQIYTGKLYIESPDEILSYEDYAARYPANTGGNKLIVIEAEQITWKNSTAPHPTSLRDVESYPYESNTYLMSALGGESWQTNGEAVYYKFTVKEDGWYNLSMKTKQSETVSGSDTASQSAANNTYIHRSITIDHKIPFKEAESMVFESTDSWEVTDLANGDTMYSVYLTAGEHVLGVEVDATMLIPVAEKISALNDEINDLSLEIRKLIGYNSDVYRDWELEKYIPGINDRLNGIADALEEQVAVLTEINMGQSRNKELTNLKICATQLRNLAEDPNEIPNRMTTLSEGSGSVSQTLGELTEGLISQPLSVDQIYLWQSDAELPDYEAGFFTKFIEGTKYFLSSFGNSDKKEEQEEITIWVNRPRNYIDLMQKMADSQFTEETGIKVNFSIMPNEQKMILSNATGTQPDAALGVSSYLPYDLAIRGVLHDLRQFDDFNEVAVNYSPGAFVTHTYDNGIYALPETQDFFVLYYRKDLLEKLGLPVPDTWQDMIEILPELQSYGMDIYIPLSYNSSYKTFSTTMPYIYQKGAAIYNDDGMTVALNSEKGLEAMKFMTDLYTIYGIPSQVGDFYQKFRNGVMPVGVSNSSTYLKLISAASELSGKWDIAVIPGFEDEDGNVVRWSTGASTSAVIFEKSDQIEESWKFVKWWSSKEVQTEFGQQLKLLYGDEYLWFSANLEAFEQLPIDEKHKQVILDQWEWLYEFPKTPASYMIEREISNVWNEIVFDGENARSALDDAVILMNQELERKMEEFGYMKDGKMVRKYEVPTVELIESWVGSNE